MISFPNAKINLGLKITGKRPDGYHTLQSLMIPIGLCDILEFVESERDAFNTSGLPVPGEIRNNLVIKALEIIRKVHKIPPLNVHLHKIIPMGAGLGGGSSDGAMMLKMLNSYFNLGITESELFKMAAALGSDCSFFVRNTGALVSGTGDISEPFEHNLSGYHLLLIDPGFPVSTADAYAGVVVNNDPSDLRPVLAGDIKDWKVMLMNDFEQNVFSKFPVLAEIKNKLYDHEAIYAAMSGSGSTIFGIFGREPELSKDLDKMVLFREKIK